GAELSALCSHLVKATVDPLLFHLVLGHAVAHESAEAVIAFVDSDRVTGAGELLCGGKTGGARADDSYAHAGIQAGLNGCGPAFFKGAFHDGKFHVFNGYCEI